MGVQQRLVSHSVTLMTLPPSVRPTEAVRRQRLGESEAVAECEMSIKKRNREEDKTKNKTKSRNKLLAGDA